MFSFPPPGADPRPLQLLAATLLAAGTCASSVLPARGADPRISEVLARNATGRADNEGHRVDWIELHNPGPDPIDLRGWFLTDSPAHPAKWRFPTVSLPPDGRLLVFASGKDRANEGAELHTNFKLSAGGEYLALVRPDGHTVAQTFGAGYPPQFPDISYGPDPASPSEFRYFDPPTPGSPNGPGYLAVALPPVFSRAGGLFTNSLEISLSATPTDADIRYTLDGSLPTTTSPAYSAPIPIAGTRLIRARSFAPSLAPSPVVGAAFTRVGADLRSFSSDLPLVVVNTFSRSPAEGTPNPMYLSVLPPGGEPARTHPAGPAPGSQETRVALEIRGSSSTQFPKKSYGIELQSEAGLDQALPLLGLPADSDWVLYAPYTDKSLIRDVLAYELSRRIGRYAPRTRFVELFLNRGNTDLAMVDYQGVYVLVEKVKISPNRVSVAGMEPDDLAEPGISGGYLLKRDRFDANDQVFTTSRGVELGIQDPKRSQIGVLQRNWIRTWLNRMESTLYGAAWRDPALGYSQHLDAESFIDHHWLVEAAKNIDGYRLSTFWHKDRSGRLSMGPLWDYNLSFGNGNYLDGWRTNTWYYPNVSDPGYTWFRRLFQDPDYLQRRIDRWFELRQGAFATPAMVDLIQNLAGQVREAQERNYNKWRILGTYIWPNWFVAKSWQEEIDWMTGWTTNHFAWIDSQFIAPPKGSHPGGYTPDGASLSLTPQRGAIYYTLNGTDPRAAGGSVSPQARLYESLLTIDRNARVVARSRSGTNWSAPFLATFVLTPPTLAITEIQYHPAPSQGPDREAAEFVELRNTGDAPQLLDGVRLDGSIQFTFPTGSGSLLPGEHLAVARNQTRLRTLAGPSPRLAGDFSPALPDNTGTLRLTGAYGEPIQEIHYDARWYRTTDGGGYSLTVVNDQLPSAEASQPGNWRPSLLPGGTPGRANVLDRGAPTLLGLAPSLGGWRLRYLGTPGLAGTLQSTPALNPPTWTRVLDFVPTSTAVQELVLPESSSQTALFYRLVIPRP